MRRCRRKRNPSPGASPRVPPRRFNASRRCSMWNRRAPWPNNWRSRRPRNPSLATHRILRKACKRFATNGRRLSRASSGGAGMKALTLTVAGMVGGAAPIAAEPDQPPLIDRNLFFGEIAISGAQISPDGRFISFLKPYKGTRNIWVKGADEPFSAPRPVSAEATRPIRSYFWSRDSKYILYSQDSGGDENFNIYAIDPTLAADPKTGVPPPRALTNLKGVRTQIFSVPKAKPDILYIGLNDRDPKWHDLYELHLSTGEKTLVRKNTEKTAGWVFDHAGTLAWAERTNQAGDTEILRVDPEGFKQIYNCTVLEGCRVAGFDAANKQVYLITNKGSLDLTELDLLDPATTATTKVESDPEKRVDLGRVQRSDVDYRMLFTQYEDDRVRLYFKDKA